MFHSALITLHSQLPPLPCFHLLNPPIIYHLQTDPLPPSDPLPSSFLLILITSCIIAIIVMVAVLFCVVYKRLSKPPRCTQHGNKVLIPSLPTQPMPYLWEWLWAPLPCPAHSGQEHQAGGPDRLGPLWSGVSLFVRHYQGQGDACILCIEINYLANLPA